MIYPETALEASAHAAAIWLFLLILHPYAPPSLPTDTCILKREFGKRCSMFYILEPEN